MPKYILQTSFEL